MNNIAKRTYLALALACLLLFGLLTFLVRYVLYSGKWVTYSGSPHVYSSDGNLDTGVVTDRSGTVLLDTTDGREYSEDKLIRKATLHLLGDREGNIPRTLLDTYAEDLVGYDAFTGTYGVKSGGGNLKLTVSAQVQSAALTALDGRKGTVGVYNYKTGEILCAVSSPTFDPDSVPDIAGDTTGAYDGAYVNRFFYAAYPPGSIFKLVTAAAAIENIPDIFEQSFTCEGSCEFEGDTIVCEGVHGSISFKNALAQSCNCAFAQIANQLGEQTLLKYAYQTGVGTSYSFDGIHTQKGSVELQNGTQSDVAWAGIGQLKDLINPCEYMVYMGAIANGGTAARPYIVASASSGNVRRYSASQSMTGKMLQTQTAKQLQELMRNNVTEVYGSWNFPDVNVCAKSGTAEVGGGNKPNAMFTGFITDEEYPLAFIVVVENGGSGSGVAGPVAGKVLQACINVLDGES